MNKTMEYMAFGLPVVAFDLRETRVSAGGRGRVRESRTRLSDLARLLVELIDDRDRRQEMGAAGRKRVETELAWSQQAPGTSVSTRTSDPSAIEPVSATTGG